MIVGLNFVSSPGTGQAVQCDGPIINATIVDAGLTIGVIENGNITVNGSLVNGSIINDTVVVDDDMMIIGAVMDVTRMETECDC